MTEDSNGVRLILKENPSGSLTVGTETSDICCGLTAEVWVDELLHIVTDPYEGHASLDPEALPVLIEALRRMAARTSGQVRYAGLQASVRFGKQLAGAVIDCYVDSAGVEWVPLTQARDAVDGFDRIGADRLADEVASLVARGLLDSRSAAADALLDYREPPLTPRSDRLAALEEEPARIRRELLAALPEHSRCGCQDGQASGERCEVCWDCGWAEATEAARAALDRICPAGPEEG